MSIFLVKYMVRHKRKTNNISFWRNCFRTDFLKAKLEKDLTWQILIVTERASAISALDTFNLKQNNLQWVLLNCISRSYCLKPDFYVIFECYKNVQVFIKKSYYICIKVFVIWHLSTLEVIWGENVKFFKFWCATVSVENKHKLECMYKQITLLFCKDDWALEPW